MEFRQITLTPKLWWQLLRILTNANKSEKANWVIVYIFILLPPGGAKQGTEVLRGQFHKLTQVEGQVREGFLEMTAFFFPFFLLLSTGIFFFQNFFFFLMMMIIGKRTYIFLVTMIFFFHLTSSCMSLSRHIALCLARPLKSSEKPHVPGSACRMGPDGKSYVKYQVFGKNHSAVPTHFKVLTLEVAGEKTLHLCDAQSTCGWGSPPGEHFLDIVENDVWVSSGTLKWETL